MSPAVASQGAEERLLTFEAGGTFYALPIAGVLEVTEVSHIACIPSLPTRIGGVINYHGDALPVVRFASLFEGSPAELSEASNILVITDRATDAARLGLPVDRVHGLVNGRGATSVGTDVVAERRSIDGRVVSVLDSVRLVARAKDVIESSLSRTD